MTPPARWEQLLRIAAAGRPTWRVMLDGADVRELLADVDQLRQLAGGAPAERVSRSAEDLDAPTDGVTL